MAVVDVGFDIYHFDKGERTDYDHFLYKVYFDSLSNKTSYIQIGKITTSDVINFLRE